MLWRIAREKGYNAVVDGIVGQLVFARQRMQILRLDLVELVMSLEEEFGTEISDEDAEKIPTVQDAVHYVDEHLNQ